MELFSFLKKYFKADGTFQVTIHPETNLEDRVANYLNGLKKQCDGATIPELCKRFKMADDFGMAEIVGRLEEAGKAFLTGFEEKNYIIGENPYSLGLISDSNPDRREFLEGIEPRFKRLIHFARYTGTD